MVLASLLRTLIGVRYEQARSSRATTISTLAPSASSSGVCEKPAPATTPRREGPALIGSAESCSTTKFVLIVEDDVDLSASFAEVLETEGYRVTIAANGQEALDQLENGDLPELILLDMRMPVMDAWEFREKQQKIPQIASIPVVAVTADETATHQAALLEVPAYLSKPVTIECLLEAVESVCGRVDA